MSRQVSTRWQAGSCAQPAAPGRLEFRAACASAGGTGTVQKPGHPRSGKKQGDRSAFTSERTHHTCPPPMPHAHAAARPGAPTHTHSEGPERLYSCWAPGARCPWASWTPNAGGLMLHHPVFVIISTSADILGPSLCIRHCHELLTHTDMSVSYHNPI